MKIVELINQIDPTKQTGYDADINQIAEEFGINCYLNDYDIRLKYYFTKPWHCTATYVGERAYFLDNEFVMYSVQYGRKMNEHFYFPSHDAHIKVKEYIVSLITTDNIQLIDLNTEVPKRFQLEYNNQIINKVGWYNDQLVKIIKTHFQFELNNSDYLHAVIIDLDGKQLKVNVNDLWFDYNTI